jgi:membrane protease YdiL (CAAX protease family)
MGIYVEAIILYIVLFMSGSIAQFTGTAAGADSFSAAKEIVKILFYFIPSLALIWYLLIKAWKLEFWIVRPGKKDLTAFLITFPVLLFTGFVISFISSTISESSGQTSLYSPGNFFEWAVLCFSCIFSAYLEESYFRFYLLSRKEELNLSSTSALFLSVSLFSICHIYEGPWGFLNAVLSGTFLAFIFLRYNSLHGIAIAHALYNISVYIINALIH